MNRIVKTFNSAGAIPHQRLVMFTANDGEVALATGPAVAIAGVVDFPGGVDAAGKRIDVVLFGPAKVEFGGVVTPGAFVTSDANGKAVAAAPAAGVNNTSGGRALVNAVSGDIAETIVNVSRPQG